VPASVDNLPRRLLAVALLVGFGLAVAWLVKLGA
jgi:hypothetical protein